MQNFAIKVANKSKRGDIFCLEGELSSGKTFFVKSFANFFGIKKISSPTFSFINIYRNKKGLEIYHMDAYRIKSHNEANDVGFEDYFFSNGICFIEWASKIKYIIPDFATWIYFEKKLNFNEFFRRVKIITKNKS
jgi:tRNA threonylcarbamoyladenosine biosynthesis protein TsaE